MHPILELLYDKHLFPTSGETVAASEQRLEELTGAFCKFLSPDQWNDCQDILVESGYISELEARAAFERGFALCAQLYALLQDCERRPFPKQTEEEV